MTTKNTNTSRTYGYVRISTTKQSIERQKTNIKSVYPDAILIEDEYTGTKIEGRRNFEKLIKTVKTGDRIVFDSVSRMSRNAEEGYTLYQRMYDNGVDLIFIKEPYINTETYRNATKNAVPMTGTNVDLILRGVNEYLMTLAKEQIKIAFDQAEKEVTDLHKRTREGIREVKARNARIMAGIEDGEIKQIGRTAGDKLITKKSIEKKKEIKEKSRDFLGAYIDEDLIKVLMISRNTFYKYKRELKEEMANEGK